MDTSLRMQGLALILALFLMWGNVSSEDTVTEEEAKAHAAAESARSSTDPIAAQAAVYVTKDGEELSIPQDGSDRDTYNFENVLQALGQEVEREGIKKTLEVQKIIENLARAYLKGDLKGPPTIKGTVLDKEKSGRRKRQLSRGAGLWENGIVPYRFDVLAKGDRALTPFEQESYKLSMAYIQENTCIKFVKWTPTLQQELGHKTNNHLQVIVNGCWSSVGAYSNGQRIAPCPGVPGDDGVRGGTHETFHALGFIHEYLRADREPYVQYHMESQYALQRYVAESTSNTVYVRPYDYSSREHNSRYSSSWSGGPPLDARDPDENFLLGRPGDSSSLYDFMGVDNVYGCYDKCYANKSNPVCQNDGYVNARCECVCPEFLTGRTCEQLIPDHPPTAWPEGNYGLPASSSGCPDGGWETGSWGHAMAGSAAIEGGKEDLVPEVHGDFYIDHFCMKSSSGESSGSWPAGDYCIYQQGDTCPQGFKSGWILIDDVNSPSRPNTVEGKVPKGEYGKDTKFYYCCRQDLPYVNPIALPTSKPFVLFQLGHGCQIVKDMFVEGFYNRYDLFSYPHIETEGTVARHSKSRNDLWLYHCHYTPYNYDGCGGELTLGEENPTTEIKSPNYPQNYDNSKKCVWYVKAPVNSTVIVDFEHFEIEGKEDGTCQDSLEVRYHLRGQPGHRYCGESMRRSIVTFRGFVVLIFRSDRKNTRKGFHAKLRYIKKQEWCYNTTDYGATYNGTMNYTNQYSGCAPWDEVRHCPVDSFDKKYLFSRLVGNNYCRNPTGFRRPWCYIDEWCNTQFCDVCGQIKCFDRWADCGTPMKRDPQFCKTEQAFKECHKSCNHCGAFLTKQDVSCSPPDLIVDDVLIVSPKTSYQVGEELTLSCKAARAGEQHTGKLTCLSDGTWAGIQAFCSDSCLDGWSRYRNDCYKLTASSSLSFDEAKAACEADQAVLTSIRNGGEQSFVGSGSWFWIGLSNVDLDGKWVWLDGSNTSYTNWGSTPPQADQPYGYVRSDDKWKTYGGSEKTYGVCRKHLKKPGHKEVVVDESAICHQVVTDYPSICSEKHPYALAFCRKTCGITYDECISPGNGENTVAVVTKDYLQVSEVIEYKCRPLYKLASGNLARTCLSGGQLSGEKPVCKPEGEFEDKYGYFVSEGYYSAALNKVTVSSANGTTIRRPGQVVGWEVHSRSRTPIYLQVWRPHPERNDTYTLVGENLVNVLPLRKHTYRVPPFDRFSVKPGDVIGWSTKVGVKGGLTYDSCKKSYDNRTIWQVDHSDDITEGSQVKFYFQASCRTYKVAVIVGKETGTSYANIAGQSLGGRCIAASEAEDLCSLANDGGFLTYASSWTSPLIKQSSFIKIQFSSEYWVIGVTLAQGLDKTGQIGTVGLLFSDNSTQKVVLALSRGDAGSVIVHSQELKPVKARWVEVRIEEITATVIKGINEIQFFTNSTCPPHWELFEGNCYGLNKTTGGFTDVEAACKSQSSSTLTSVTSKAENNFIQQMAKNGKASYLWIGFTDRVEEGKWRWLDGSISNETNWEKPEPNNRGNQDCAVLVVKSGLWNDLRCSDQYASICKRPVKPNVPATVTYGNPTVAANGFQGSSSEGYIYIEHGASMTVPKDGYINRWKIYARVSSYIVMMVIRPLDVIQDTYAYIGENQVQTHANRVTFTDIPEASQVKVRAGDLVAWYYPPDVAIPLVFHSCSGRAYTLYSKHPTTAPLVAGQVITGSRSGNQPCLQHSVGYQMSTEKLIHVNVASASMRAECSGASSSVGTCGLVLDGGLRAFDSSWVVDPSYSGDQWMSIKLHTSYRILGGRVMQGLHKAAQIKTLKVELENGKETEVTLTERQGSSAEDYSAQLWDMFQLDPAVETDSAKIFITETYTPGKVELIEFELHAHACPVGWKAYKEHCYIHQSQSSSQWMDGEASCAATAGHLTTVEDQDENDFIQSMISSSWVFIGYTRKVNSTVWEGVDGSTLKYENWGTDKPEGTSDTQKDIYMNKDGSWAREAHSWKGTAHWVCKVHASFPYSKTVFTSGNRVEPRKEKTSTGDVGYIYIERSSAMEVPRRGSIQGWKLYSDKAAEIVMMVLRPVSGSDVKFTIVGENVVVTPEGRTDVIRVPEFDRIEVEKGDYVGWYYLPGSDGTLQYDSCSGEVTAMYADYRSVLHYGPGQEIQFIKYKCRVYSVGYILDTESLDPMFNVAPGSSCSSSTSPHTCHLAYDGCVEPFASSWVAVGEGVGAWMEVTLEAEYILHGVRIQQLLASNSQIKTLDLTFTDGKKQQLNFRNRVGSVPSDYSVQIWDPFKLENVSTKSVKATVTAVYGPQPVGLIEMELLASGCAVDWTMWRKNCYKFHGPASKTVQEAEDVCTSHGGHMSTANSKEENVFLSNTAKGDWAFLGQKRNGSKWQTFEGKDLKYTNWDLNEGNGDNCAYLKTLGQGRKWADISCDYKSSVNWICKREIGYKKTPAASVYGNIAKPRDNKDGLADVGYFYVENSPSLTVKKAGSIEAWKLYTANPAEITMLVFRPVPGSQTQLTLVGENLLLTPDSRMDIIPVPEFDRINVRKGDLVGWYYLPASNGTMVYDTCSTGLKCMYSKHSTSQPVAVGESLDFTPYKCRKYSVSYILNESPVPKLYNMGLSSKCNASTNADQCIQALNGGLNAADSSWVGAGVGSWIEVTLPGMYPVQGVRIQLGLSAQSRIKTMELTFSDGSNQQLQFRARKGADENAYQSQGWDAFEVKNINTSSVKATVKAVYGSEAVRLIEFQILSTGCPVGWATFAGHCYKYYSGAATLAAAEADCVKEGAHVSTVKSQAENDFLQKMREAIWLYLGYTYVDGLWKGYDGSVMTYKNWDDDEPGTPGEKKCAYMIRSGKWAGMNCSNGYAGFWICQKRAGWDARYQQERLQSSSNSVRMLRRSNRNI